MTTVYVADQGTVLSKTGERLLIRKGERVIRWIHAADVDQVVLFGNISITAPTISFLLTEGIDTVFLSVHGKYRGRLVADLGKNVILRRAQFERLGDSGFALDHAKRCVAGKMENGRSLLRKYNREARSDTLGRSIRRMTAAIEALSAAVDLDTVRGLEGTGSRAYFEGFGAAIRNPDMPFRKRTRRPPRDEVNAALSFGYTLLGNAVQTALNTVGLDPYFGGLHAAEYGRPSLVLDLMEEFRPVAVDALVLRMINRRMLTRNDFVVRKEATPPVDEEVEMTDLTSEDYPVLFSLDGRKTFIRQFETRLGESLLDLASGGRVLLKEAIGRQARMLVNAIKGETPYEPFRMG
jgi:CRISPR-associated protein Cas1